MLVIPLTNPHKGEDGNIRWKNGRWLWLAITNPDGSVVHIRRVDQHPLTIHIITTIWHKPL